MAGGDKDTKFSRADVANDGSSVVSTSSKSFGGSLDFAVDFFDVLSVDFNISDVGLLLRGQSSEFLFELGMGW